MNDRSALFISTFNEIEALPKQFPRIPISTFDEVYALDGGSTDGTLEFYEKNGIEVIKAVKRERSSTPAPWPRNASIWSSSHRMEMRIPMTSYIF